jgi:hypothetical protein
MISYETHVADPAAHDGATRRGRERAREVFTGRQVSTLSVPELEAARAAGYEPSESDWLIGRDPRKMQRSELEAMGHAPMSPMEAIRARCLDCCAGSAYEVRCCVATTCPSWPFRTGKNPWRAPISEERREALRQRSPFSSGLHKTEGSTAGSSPSATPV